jgi:hypothetical protein
VRCKRSRRCTRTASRREVAERQQRYGVGKLGAARICCASSPRQLARDVQLSAYDAGPRQRSSHRAARRPAGVAAGDALLLALLAAHSRMIRLMAEDVSPPNHPLSSPKLRVGAQKCEANRGWQTARLGPFAEFIYRPCRPQQQRTEGCARRGAENGRGGVQRFARDDPEVSVLRACSLPTQHRHCPLIVTAHRCMAHRARRRNRNDHARNERRG